MQHAPLRLAAAFTGFALAAACGRGAPDPVQGLLDELVAAAEARDAARVTARLSTGFRGPGAMGRADAEAQLRRTLAAYESVSVEVWGLEVERQEAAARLRFHAEFSGRARRVFGLDGLLPPGAVYRFEVAVRQEDDAVWRAVSAEWDPVQ
jgi:hypothetical protein